MGNEDNDYKLDKIVSKVLEAHGLLPEGKLYSDAKDAATLYKEELKDDLANSDPDSERERILLSRVEEILLTEGLLPSAQDKKFEESG
jgi:hypothetical protein